MSRATGPFNSSAVTTIHASAEPPVGKGRCHLSPDAFGVIRKPAAPVMDLADRSLLQRQPDGPATFRRHRRRQAHLGCLRRVLEIG